MEWTAGVDAGDWIRARLDDPWSATMHDVVPRGFEAYARIFHPASVQELPDGRMPSFDQWREMPWEQQEPVMAQMTERPVTWAETATAFGTLFHATAQWGALVRVTDHADDWQQVAAPDGRWFNAPPTGELDSDLVAVVSGILTAHTTTPDDGFVALWEGSGGLVGHLGESPSRTFFQIGDPGDAALAHHNEMLGHALKDRFNNPYRKATWQEGILSREISEGPRLELPGRGHVLFRGGVRDLAQPDWVLHVPWRDRIAEQHGFDPSAQSPSIVWPADRAWIMVTEVDFDSTIVGGSAALITAIVADDRCEALALSEGSALTWDSDELNG